MGSVSKATSCSSASFFGFFVLLVSISLVLIVVKSPTAFAAVPHKRSVTEEGNQSNHVVETCRSYHICGWEVYEPYTRNLEYYVPGRCKCPANETCIQTDDDLANSAYIYKCRVIPVRKNRNRNKGTSRPNSGAAVAVSPS